MTRYGRSLQADPTTMIFIDYLRSLRNSRRLRIVNFFSDVANLGNYTPVWGIWKMLPAYRPALLIDGRKYASVDIDAFDVAIVGGAALFTKTFEPFWTWLAQSKIQIVMWGLGGGWAYEDTPISTETDEAGNVDPGIIDRLRDRIVLVNVRDRMTDDMYKLNAHISFCPTAVYFEERRRQIKPGRNVLCVHHAELVNEMDKKIIFRNCDIGTRNFAVMGETFEKVTQKYIGARMVVTSRLHGAIIANSLGRPYVAYVKDSKLWEFHRQFGSGLATEDLDEIPSLIERIDHDPNAFVPHIDYGHIKEFGKRVERYLDGINT